MAGETPKRFTLRLRLDRAAVMLLVGRESILDIALACGFQSHEAFTRSFRERFGMSPRAYRKRGFAGNPSSKEGQQHADFVERVGPCLGLYHTRGGEGDPQKLMTYSVTKQHIAPQPVLLVRRSVKRSEIAAAITQALGKIFQHAQQHGIALTGHPLTRYIEVRPGLMTIEPAMRIASGGPVASDPTLQVLSDTLPGGLAAKTTHFGKYDDLHEAYAAIELWMKAEGATSGGAPWEDYVTDPAETPDPKNWRTDVYWPLAQ